MFPQSIHFADFIDFKTKSIRILCIKPSPPFSGKKITVFFTESMKYFQHISCLRDKRDGKSERQRLRQTDKQHSHIQRQQSHLQDKHRLAYIYKINRHVHSHSYKSRHRNTKKKKRTYIKSGTFTLTPTCTHTLFRWLHNYNAQHSNTWYQQNVYSILETSHYTNCLVNLSKLESCSDAKGSSFQRSYTNYAKDRFTHAWSSTITPGSILALHTNLIYSLQ